MPVIPLPPKTLLAIGLLALTLALLAALAAAPDLGTLDFSAGAGGADAPASAGSAESSGTPSWVADPMAPPVELLR